MHLPLKRNDAYYLLQSCDKTKDLQNGKRVLSLLIYSGLESIAVFGDHLIRLFTYHNKLLEANEIFDNITNAGMHTWAAIIQANAKLDHGCMALELYDRMELLAVEGDAYVYVAVLKACVLSKSILHGRIVHEKTIDIGLHSNLVVGNVLIDLYAKCGSSLEARSVFNELKCRDMISWNTTIAGYAQNGQHILALECFEQMLDQGLQPNAVSWGALIAGFSQHGNCILALEFCQKMQQEHIVDRAVLISGLKACAITRNIEQGRLMHDQIIRNELYLDVVVASSLIDMYAKCESLQEAESVFHRLPKTNVVLWNSLILGYARHEGLLALDYFHKMQEAGLSSDAVAFVSILKACANVPAIAHGRLIHDKIIKSTFNTDVIGSALIHMYSRCGSLEEACKVFESLPKGNVVSWNAMIAGLVEQGEGFIALQYLQKLQHEGIQPDVVTFLCSLKACASISELEEGRLIHGKIIKNQLEHSVVMGNTLLDMYTKGGSLAEAHNVFNKLPVRDVVSWGAIIAGHTQKGEGLVVLESYEEMQEEGICPNLAVFLPMLKVCGSIGATIQGRVTHECIIRNGFHYDTVVGSALVDMYSNCGSLEEAREIFHKLPRQNIVTWGAMIAGYAQHGKGFLALQYSEMMQQEDIKLNDIIFTTILIACSRAGLVDLGCWYFKSMGECHDITPTIFHYMCMIDLLGREGCLDEAEDLLQSSTLSNIMGWTSLLSACKVHSNIDVGRECFDQIAYLDSLCTAGYVLMSNIYAANAQMLEEENGIFFRDDSKIMCLD